MPPVLNHLWPSASPPGQYAHPPSFATLNGLEGSTGGLRRCVLRMQMNWMRARSISRSLFGAGDWIWTRGPLVGNQMLYQAELLPRVDDCKSCRQLKLAPPKLSCCFSAVTIR